MTQTPTRSVFAATHPPARPGRFISPRAQSQIDDARPKPKPTLMRRYEVLHLDRDGLIADFRRVAPALPAFEAAFSAFARGAPVQTERGVIAVEDLMPGDRVRTVGHGIKPLLWKGSTTVVPSTQGQSPEMGHLTRISSEAFGFGRPSSDLVFGPAAQFYHGAPGVHQLTGQDGAFFPLRDFIDGVNVVELTPMSPVPVFHLGFATQEQIIVGGLEVESYHPGSLSAFDLRGDMLNLFLSLFPGRRSLSDFGPASYRRLRLRDLDAISAA
jgi:hypothetical protein